VILDQKISNFPGRIFFDEVRREDFNSPEDVAASAPSLIPVPRRVDVAFNVGPQVINPYSID
jgi:hypothetical protein